MHGDFEAVVNKVAIGWLWDPATPDAHKSFNLVVNGHDVGTFFADQYRRDLQLADIGQGDHGFEIEIRPEWLTRDENVFSIHTDRGELVKELRLEVARNGRPLLRGAQLASIGESHSSPVVRSSQKPYTLLSDSQVSAPAPGASLPSSIATDRVRALVDALIDSDIKDAKSASAFVSNLFKAKRYDDICLIGPVLLERYPNEYPLYNELGRSHIYLGHIAEAAAVLETLRDLFPKRHGAIFYLGTVYTRQRKFSAALEIFRECLKQKSDEAKYALEAGRAAISVVFGDYGSQEADPALLEDAFGYLQAAHRLAPADFRACRELAALHLHRSEIERARHYADEAVVRNRNAPGAWQALAQVAFRQGDLVAARNAFAVAEELAPDADWPKFGSRLVQRLTEKDAATESHQWVGLEPVDDLAELEIASDLLRQLNTVDAEWVSFGKAEFPTANEQVAKWGFQWAGAIADTPEQPASTLTWRKSALIRLLETGLFDTLKTVPEFLKRAARHLAVSGPDLSYSARAGRPLVLLISQYGPRRFGGAEQFLFMMAGLYRKLGYDVLLVGTRAEFVGETGKTDGFRYTFIHNDPDQIFKLAVQKRAAVVHVVSGLGFEVSSAIRHLNIALIFGVHFWRELYYNSTPSLGFYPDIDEGGQAKPEFRVLLEDSAALYSNSNYTRDVIEREFKTRTPVLYSLPADVDSPPTGLEERKGVLLVNARFDKGFGLLLAVAELAPHLSFTAIASQSEAALALSEVEARGLTNVTILSRQNDMPQLYRSMRAVMVPSYQFIETFSRVVIEAHRYGLPVVGSDRGNVPLLLTESGVALPESPALWAEELDRLCSDDDYWRERSARAIENSARYEFGAQRRELQLMVNGARRPILVGVGSGLGNIIHATPTIRNIAMKLGQRVDVVVAGDHEGLLFTVANSDFVNHVFPLSEIVSARRYDTVFLTHSFGPLVPRLSARRVLLSRDWDQFRPGHSLHEAEFNLAAAEALLGTGYTREDVAAYSIGNYRYFPPSEILIGFHGGSKAGAWATKRWPGFAELAARLQERGFAVASFGIPSEYVPGTIDMTGGTIEEMTQRMMACSHFVSNDSGVMNVANALGIPLIALFGPTNALTRGPLAASSMSIAVRKECAPCEMHASEADARFRSGACACIGDISVEQVLEVLLRQLGEWKQEAVTVVSGADLLEIRTD